MNGMEAMQVLLNGGAVWCGSKDSPTMLIDGLMYIYVKATKSWVLPHDATLNAFFRSEFNVLPTSEIPSTERVARTKDDLKRFILEAVESRCNE